MIPKRKKTPEEIARLRESMGLPEASPAPPADIPASIPAPESPAPPAEVPAPVEEIPAPPPDPRPPVEAKPVRSLRKSERIPAAPSPAANPAKNPPSNLPTQRRTESELNRIRRSQSFESNQTPPANHLLAQTANPLIVGLGYALAFAAAFMPFADHRYWFRAPFPVTAILAGISLVIAAFIFLKKKRSVHNACFIAAIAFFTLVFSALYYFPQLRNAS